MKNSWTCKHQPKHDIDSDIETEKDRHFRHLNQHRQILGLANINDLQLTCKDLQFLELQIANDKFWGLQTSTQTCKQIDPHIQTQKDRHFRHSNQKRQILGLANTNPHK
jgi:hypothetical protein